MPATALNPALRTNPAGKTLKFGHREWSFWETPSSSSSLEKSICFVVVVVVVVVVVLLSFLKFKLRSFHARYIARVVDILSLTVARRIKTRQTNRRESERSQFRHRENSKHTHTNVQKKVVSYFASDRANTLIVIVQPIRTHLDRDN